MPHQRAGNSSHVCDDDIMIMCRILILILKPSKIVIFKIPISHLTAYFSHQNGARHFNIIFITPRNHTILAPSEAHLGLFGGKKSLNKNFGNYITNHLTSINSEIDHCDDGNVLIA